MKSHAWLLAISFVPFSIFGFLFANLSSLGIKKNDPAVPTLTVLEVQSQTNILFISVDTDEKPNPRLVSLWGLFFSTNNLYVAEIIPLYPSTDSMKDTVLLSEFYLTPNKHLDQKFLDLSQKTFEVKWDAYIVVNQKEIAELSRILGMGMETTDSSTASEEPDTVLLNQLCTFLKSSERNFDLLHILDTQVLNHNLSNSILASFDQWIKAGQPFSSCEVQH